MSKKEKQSIEGAEYSAEAVAAYTTISNVFKELKLSTYSVTDAKAFPSWINSEKKDEVLQRAKSAQALSGGYGVQIGKSFSAEMIRQTAKKVKETKTGVCHTFAQLGAQELKLLMDAGKIHGTITVVTHEDGQGSHTFAMFALKSSEVLIVDPWAAAMGWGNSGVFTPENYPFPIVFKNFEKLAEKFKLAPAPEQKQNQNVAQNAVPAAQPQQRQPAVQSALVAQSAIAGPSRAAAQQQRQALDQKNNLCADENEKIIYKRLEVILGNRKMGGECLKNLWQDPQFKSTIKKLAGQLDVSKSLFSVRLQEYIKDGDKGMTPSERNAFGHVARKLHEKHQEVLASQARPPVLGR